MGAQPSSLTSLFPGANVSGSNISTPKSPLSGIGEATLGGNVNPFLPTSIGTGMSLPSFPSTASAASGFPANTGGSSIPVSSAPPGGTAPNTNDPLGLGMNQGQWNSLLSSLKGTFGEHFAPAILQFLQSGAGYNPQVLQNLVAQLQPQIERGQQNLLEQFSASGNRFGSPAALGLADYESQIQTGINTMASQLYEQSIQNYMNVLMDAGNLQAKNKASSPSIWDTISGALGLGGSVAGGLSEALGAGGIFGNILDTIAKAGGA